MSEDSIRARARDLLGELGALLELAVQLKQEEGIH